jgi:peptide/nickel transport system substrate-binding protein
VLAALVMATTVVACSSGGSGGGSPQGDGSSGAGATGVSDPNGILRYGLEFGINLSSTFDPAKSASDCDRIVLAWIYDTLVHTDDNGKPVPGLASSWDLRGRTFTLHLRPNVTFSDGTPFDAAAVKGGLEYLKTGDQTGPDLARVASITVVNPTTLRLALNDNTGSTLPLVLTGRDGMIPSPKSLAAKNTATKPVGAGPYRFTAFRPGSKISLRKWSGFWNPPAQSLGGIDFTQVAVGGPAVDALRSKAVDLITFEADSLNELRHAEGIATDLRPSEQYLQIQFRTSRPPFNNLKVRQAVNYALDRDKINKIELGGTGEVAWMPFPKSNSSYDATVANRYPFSQEKARQLLADAGYPHGLTIEMVYPGGGIALMERQKDLVISQLGAVGIRVKPIPSTEIANDYYLSKKGDAFTAARLPDSNPTGQVADQWGKFQFVAIHNGAERDDITALVKHAQSIDPTTAEFTSTMHKIMKIIVDNALEAAIAFQPRNIAWSTTAVLGKARAPRGTCDPIGLDGVTIRKKA